MIKARSYINKNTIFGYIDGTKLGINSVKVGIIENFNISAEIKSVVVRYFNIAGKVRVQLKDNFCEKPDQIYFCFNIKNPFVESEFNSFVRDFIHLYSLDNTNLSIFHKRDNLIIHRFIRKTNKDAIYTTISNNEDKLLFIDDNSDDDGINENTN